MWMGRSHENSGGLMLNELRLFMKNITTLLLSFCDRFLEHVVVLLGRHPVGIHFEDGILLIRGPGVLLLVPGRRSPVVRAVTKEPVVDANPLDNAARLWGHGGWEVDLCAFHFLSLLIIIIVLQ